MKKILFISYGGGHVNLLLPVYKKFYYDGNYQCKFLALTTAAQVLKKNELPYYGFKNLINSENEYALEVGKKLVGEKNDASVVPYEESIAYMGLSYCDLIDHHGEQAANALYEKHGRQAFYPLRTLKKYLEQERPDLVVATSSPRAERAALAAASQLKIPSVCIVDLFAFNEIVWVGVPGFANKVCVISDYVRDRMLKAGRKPDEVVVTGNPSFDELSSCQDKEKVKEFRNSKQWRDTDKVVLWASNIEPEEHPYSDKKGDVLLPVKVEEELNKLARDNPDVRLVIRPHPNDDRLPLIHSDGAEISTQEDNLNLLLNAVDCVVVSSSTVGLQAAILGKPVISIDLSITAHYVPYSKMGISIGVDNLKDLNSTVLEAFKHPPENSSFVAIGSATDNVVDVIGELLNKF